jgi:hypothetical protein
MCVIVWHFGIFPFIIWKGRDPDTGGTEIENGYGSVKTGSEADPASCPRGKAAEG